MKKQKQMPKGFDVNNYIIIVAHVM